MKYKIVTSKSISDLEDQVNHLLNDGWRLQDGLTVYVTNNYVRSSYSNGGLQDFKPVNGFAQTMIKKEKNEKSI